MENSSNTNNQTYKITTIQPKIKMKQSTYSNLLMTVICLAGGATAAQPPLADLPAPHVLFLAQTGPTTTATQSQPGAGQFPRNRFWPPQAAATPPATDPAGTPSNTEGSTAFPPAPDAPLDSSAAAGYAGGGAGVGVGTAGGFSGMTGSLGSYSIVPPPAERGESGSLVIPVTETDPEALASSEEDLTIMGRILEKALDQNAEEEQRQAMGIRLFSMPESGRVKNMEIEGFGAVFLLNVNFPLAGPAVKPGESQTNDASNSTWDEAKRELYGPPPGTQGDPFSAAAYPREEYNPKRVEKLKETLLDAVKNASNMSSLKPNETVNIVVTGGVVDGPGYERNVSNGFTRRYSAGTAASSVAGNPHLGQRLAHVIQRVGHSGASMLTIRVKKSDIDSYAKGKLSRDEFRGKATVLTYFNSALTPPVQGQVIQVK